MDQLTEIVSRARAELDAAPDRSALDAIRVRYLGKQGVLTAQLKQLGSLPAEARPTPACKAFVARGMMGSTRERWHLVLRGDRFPVGLRCVVELGY